jgi:NDP-sugar pyrophosphorylase family protein
MKVVILAGGLASRLGDLTKKTAKILLPISCKKFIDYQLNLLSKNRIKNIIYCLGHHSIDITNYLEKHYKNDFNFFFSYDGNKQLGTGGAIKNALRFLANDEQFGMLYGDSYLDIDYNKIITFAKRKKTNLMTYQKNTNNLHKNNINKLTGSRIFYDKFSNDKLNYLDYGFSIINKDDFIKFSCDIGIFDINDYFNFLSNSNLLRGVEIKQKFYEIGSVSGYNEFIDYVLSNKEFNV